jgi:outer membrane protein TolC
MTRSVLGTALAGALLVASAHHAEGGQEVAPTRMTFKDAVARAAERNPSALTAAQEILRADALLGQVRAGALPQVSAGAGGVVYRGSAVVGASGTASLNQLVAGVTVAAPLYAPVQWALRVQSMDNKLVAELAAADVRREVAVATAQAYLAVLGWQRVLDANQRALETAQAHYQFARQLREGGAGSRLNELRAQQSVSADVVLVEEVRAGLYRAQEALGVLVADGGPVAASDEPLLAVPPSLGAAIAAMPDARTDLRLATGREKAAARVVADSWKDWLPSVSGLFVPQYTNPATSTQSAWSWNLRIAATVPVFDAGSRREKRAERSVLLKESQIAFEGLVRQANSDERTAENAVTRSERAWAAARLAAQQANEVVEIVNISFKVGASTNIEVIDAQRAARDAANAAAIAEDQLRQARLALLVALGLFPQRD